MGYIIEVSEDKISSLSEHIEKALRHAGKAMQCLEDMYEGERGYGERGYGERDDDDMYEEDERRYGRRRGGMGERRHRDARGRYM